MSVLLVTYDLRKPGQDYSDVHGFIKKHAWARLSESSYAIRTSMSPQQVYDALSKYLDANDTLLVITLTRPYYGQASKAVIDWLDECM